MIDFICFLLMISPIAFLIIILSKEEKSTNLKLPNLKLSRIYAQISIDEAIRHENDILNELTENKRS